VIFLRYVKEAAKVIGYFAHIKFKDVFCDGNACIIAGSEELMELYLSAMKDDSKYTIKKTRFGEIMSGLKNGGTYAFDKKAYDRFFHIAELNDIGGLPSEDVFLEYPDEKMNLVRIQFFES